ncbi:Protein-glutamate methylesterase/protein-glutamine glutaminase [uncultured bacterium]|nr:Protein-glutamate methylesterase/protein-glutamine glutaminase [uncultured bacterium]
MADQRKTKVMVVDDSALMRRMIPLILEKSPEIEVVATAVDGRFALSKAEKNRPDVITLDMDMPGMDGLTTLKHIVRDFGIPVVVVSSMTTRGAELTMKAFELGAMDVIAKPADAISVNIKEIAEELIEKVLAIGRSSVSKLHLDVPAEKLPEPRPAVCSRAKTAEQVIAIGISTGGPNALSYMLPLLPADLPAAVLVVQHMPAGFTEVFASRLNKACALEVREARDGDLVTPGRVLIAPGDYHMKIKKTALSTIVVLSSRPAVNGHRPSADVLFNSVAAEYGPSSVGVIMTGMGEDGAEGIGEIKKAGGRTLAQDENTSVVFGMPKAAIRRGYVDRVIPLERMAEAVAGEITWKRGGRQIAANHK